MNVSHRQPQDTLQSGSLQIGFHWHRDRFAHSISLVKSDRQLPLLASREGDSEQDWPPSPVLQELHFEDRPAGTVALLVGRTTLAHWSLAITTIGEGFSFDAACRVLGPECPVFQRCVFTNRISCNDTAHNSRHFADGYRGRRCSDFLRRALMPSYLDGGWARRHRMATDDSA